MTFFPDIFCIVDTETTGMRAAFSRIIDIGIIRVEQGKVVRRYHTLLNPGVTLPAFIKRITNITDEDLAGAPTFEEVALEIGELLEGAVFVAHNVAFDYSFVQNEFKRIGIEFRASKLCSVNLSKALFPKERSHNLDAIIDRFSIQIQERHRALPDAEAVLSFFKSAEKLCGEERVGAAVESVMDKITHQEGVTDLPDRAGVYFFYGPDQELLYIGKSKHVRTRVRSHFSKTPTGKEKRIQGETSLIRSIKTSGELSALLLEANLIKEESPLYNKALRNRKKLVVARAGMSENGYMTVRLESISDMSADDSILSVFRTTYQAKQKLEQLVVEQGLCGKLSGIDTARTSCFNYQLRKCKGACMGKVSAEEYNENVKAAFSKRRMRSWPYAGPVLIKEIESEESGTVFIIDNWILKHAYTYEHGACEPFLKQGSSFDYDTYKILARYMLNPANKHSISVLSDSEYVKYAKELNDAHEDIVYI